MIWFSDRRGAVEVAFTDRYGGADPDRGLDLAEPLPDTTDPEGDRARLEEHLGLVADSLARDPGSTGALPDGAPDGAGRPRVVRMRQVHGTAVHIVDPSWLSGGQEPPEADGLATDMPGVALLVRAADCVPVLLADPDAGVVGAAHAGRKGLAAGVVPATVERMRSLGARRLTGWLGPHVCGSCYEVPEAMQAEVVAAVPPAHARTRWDTPGLDLGAGVRAQLEQSGVDLVDVARCTFEEPDLYSYRRDGRAAGRLGGLVWRRS